MKRLIPAIILGIAAASLSSRADSVAVNEADNEFDKAKATICHTDSLLASGLQNMDAHTRDSLRDILAYNCAVAALECLDEGSDRPDEALHYARKGLAIASDPEVTTALNRAVATACEMKGTKAEVAARFDEADSLYSLSAQAYEAAGRIDREANVYLKIAAVYDRMHRKADTEEAVGKAEHLARLSGDDRVLFLTMVDKKKYARYNDYLPDYLAASMTLDSLREATTDPTIERDAVADMAETALAAGDLQRATGLYVGLLHSQEAMDSCHERDVLVTGTLDKLADLYQEGGDYTTSIDYARRNLRFKTSGGTKSPLGEALTYHRLSTSYASLNDKTTAAAYADSIILATREITQPFYRAYMNLLAGISYKQIQVYDSALICHTRALEYPALHTQLHALIGGVHHLMGHNKEALKHYEEHMRMTGERLGTTSPNYASAKRYVANMKVFAGDPDGGAADYISSISITQQLLRERLRLLPSGLRRNYLGALTEALSEMTPFGIVSGHTCDSFSTKAYEGLLLTKGLLLASEQSMANLVSKHGSEADKEDYSRLQQLQSKISTLENNPAMSDSIPELYRTLIGLDHRLARNCTRYGDIGAFAITTYADIAGALGDDETLVDFTDYVDDTGKRFYCAFIIRRDMRYPTLIKVCPGAEIDTQLHDNGSLMSRLYDDEAGENLRRLCLDPLLPYLTPGKAVYIVPSGILHSISFASIPLADSTLAGDRYSMMRLSSARRLLDQPAEPQRLSALLYGGILYNMDDDEMAMASLPVDSDIAAFATRSPSASADTLPYLPYTLREINTIGHLLADTINVRHLTGKAATEASFIALSGHSPAILHLATHGFYFNPDDPDIAKGLKGYTDPMNLSGLVMSGGNAEWTGHPLPPTTLGGLLTAADISRCDLDGTSLVCLSACHTGRGSTATSEGIYGLQRAFKQAGARTLVMSLWEASELSTTLFMNHFYETLIQTGFNKQEAFVSARRAVREKYPEPYYWAGFIMVD